MQPAQPHKVIAAYFDILIFGSLLQLVGILVLSLTSSTLTTFIQITVALTYLFGVIFYHVFFARNVTFCSPGETMAGCRFTETGKQWFTLFYKSRWFLFLTLFLILLGPANAFDDMQRASAYPLAQVLGRSAYVLLILWAVYKIALGTFIWSIVIYIILTLQLVRSLYAYQASPELVQIAIWIHCIRIIFLTAALIIYRDRRQEFPATPAPHPNDL